MKESIKDKIYNNFLSLKNCTRVKLRIKRNGKQEPDLSEMSLVFNDKFETFDNKKWRIGQPWGKFHPDFSYQYYGNNSVSIKDNSLVLSQFYYPKKMQFDGMEEVFDIKQSVGLVTSHESFGYGFYKFECKLPKGAFLWPAVWISCVDSWPPEIDILEAYSDENKKYGSQLQSNFHYDFNENKKSTGPRNHPVFDNNEKLILGCWFTKDFIKIYYNGYLVRSIKDENIMRFFRDKKMTIILNNAIRPEYKDRAELINQVSEFYVYNVQYWN